MPASRAGADQLVQAELKEPGGGGKPAQGQIHPIAVLIAPRSHMLQGGSAHLVAMPRALGPGVDGFA